VFDVYCFIILILLLVLILLLLLLVCILLGRYSPLMNLPSNKTFLHSRRCLSTACLYLLPLYIFILFNFVPPSLRGLPFCLLPSIIAAEISFGILWFCVLWTKALHLSRRDIINLTISSPCNTFLISSFLFSSVLLLLRVHVFSVHLLSNILSTSAFSVVPVAVSDPQVRMGRITVTSTRTSWYGWASSVELSKSQFK